MSFIENNAVHHRNYNLILESPAPAPPPSGLTLTINFEDAPGAPAVDGVLIPILATYKNAEGVAFTAPNWSVGYSSTPAVNLGGWVSRPTTPDIFAAFTTVAVMTVNPALLFRYVRFGFVGNGAMNVTIHDSLGGSILVGIVASGGTISDAWNVINILPTDGGGFAGFITQIDFAPQPDGTASCIDTLILSTDPIP